MRARRVRVGDIGDREKKLVVVIGIRIGGKMWSRKRACQAVMHVTSFIEPSRTAIVRR